MTIVEQFARTVARVLGLPFERTDQGPAVFFGCLPPRPVKAVCVCASDLRAGDDIWGTRVQVVIRSDLDGAWPLWQAARIMTRLDGRRDVMLVPYGLCAVRLEAERGFEFAGLEGDDAQYYSAEYRIYC